MGIFTNIFGDAEVSNQSPDCSGDYYFVTDKQTDFNYKIEKMVNSFLAISSDPSDDFQIINGGIISDNGDGTIDISACEAIGYDINDNKRFIVLPALTDVPMPSGWNDGRQIWVTLKYDSKLGTETRTHKVSNSYHYQLEDTYLGDEDGLEEGDSDSLFTDSDPTGIATILGSFTMTGTTYVDQNERSIDYYISSSNTNHSPGRIIPVMFNDDPAVYGDRIILLQGQVIEIASYSDLVTKVYCGDTDNATAATFYKTSDAGGTTRDTAGNYFVLPDVRGLHLINIGNATISGRTKTGPTELGGVLEDAFQNHRHAFARSALALAESGTNRVVYGSVDDSNVDVLDPVTDGVSVPRTATYTRVSAMGTNFGITY